MTKQLLPFMTHNDSAISAVNSEASGVPHSDISIVSNNVDNRFNKDRPTNACRDAGKGRWHWSRVGGVGGS